MANIHNRLVTRGKKYLHILNLKFILIYSFKYILLSVTEDSEAVILERDKKKKKKIWYWKLHKEL